MSKIHPALYSSEAHDWQTPPDFIERLLKFEKRQRFDLDVACTQQNVPARIYCKEHEVDSLTVDWTKPVILEPFPADPLCWMNPPYGNLLPKFVKKAYEEYRQGCRIWGLIPARPDTTYWHQYVFSAQSIVIFLKGRLKFIKPGSEELKGDGTAPFPTALIYWGSDWKDVAIRFVQEKPFEGTITLYGGSTVEWKERKHTRKPEETPGQLSLI